MATAGQAYGLAPVCDRYYYSEAKTINLQNWISTHSLKHSFSPNLLFHSPLSFPPTDWAHVIWPILCCAVFVTVKRGFLVQYNIVTFTHLLYACICTAFLQHNRLLCWHRELTSQIYHHFVHVHRNTAPSITEQLPSSIWVLEASVSTRRHRSSNSVIRGFNDMNVTGCFSWESSKTAASANDTVTIYTLYCHTGMSCHYIWRSVTLSIWKTLTYLLHRYLWCYNNNLRTTHATQTLLLVHA